ncbi:MAG: HAD family hydrolase [Candidatus Eremiobacteraeota bacterium]|nr:HAD family hydrolase [Candidatus Eremiobacteraeota bacterium]
MPPGVGFDFDHTLGIDNKLERVAFLRVLDRLIDAGGAPLGNLVEETKSIDDLLTEQRGGAFTIHEAVMRFSRARLPHGDAEPFVAMYKTFALESVDYFVVPLPGARALLKTLRRRRVPAALLTNGWSPLQERKAAAVGFDGPVIVSERLGAQKPDRRAFDALVTALGVPRAEAWYVGDQPVSDVAGSITAGLRGVWLDAESLAYPPGLVAPTCVIHNLESLLEVLPGSKAPA